MLDGVKYVIGIYQLVSTDKTKALSLLILGQQ